MDPIKVTALAVAAQALFTLVLILVTARYVSLTGRLAKSAEEQIKLGTTPNLIFQATPYWSIVNLGQYSAYIQAVWVEQLDSSGETAVGHGLLTTGTRILLDWKKIAGPNQEIRVQVQGMPSAAAALLSGRIRLAFYFVYGPTGGDRTHMLDLRMEVGSLGAIKVHEQRIRLNEAIPQVPATQIDQIQPVRRSK